MNNSKTLVFCFDGTGNEPSDAGNFQEDESISNVLKLHILMGGGLEHHPATQTPGGNPQQTFYYNGIGTLQSGRRIPLLGRLYHAGRAQLNMAFAPSWATRAASSTKRVPTSRTPTTSPATPWPSSATAAAQPLCASSQA